jgi:peptidoglycan/LPS O-acetylase OafA/YrhL
MARGTVQTFTGIQAMRGVAALVVAHLFSTRWEMGFTQFAGTTIGGFLRFGVALSFVISGFIIAMTADKIGKTEGRRG